MKNLILDLVKIQVTRMSLERKLGERLFTDDDFDNFSSNDFIIKRTMTLLIC